MTQDYIKVAEKYTNKRHLKEEVYRDESLLAKRRALYEYTTPPYIIEDEVIKLLQLTGKERFLDVGCGNGSLLLKIASQFPDCKLKGVDISEGMFEKAKKEAETRGLSINFQVGDIEQLDFPNESFDRVTTIHTIYHVPKIEKAIAQMARVLKKDGILVLTANSLKSKPVLREFKKEAAEIMKTEEYPDTTLRFNLENGREFLEKYFDDVRLVPFESRLVLKEAQPYIDYFDSTRPIWEPQPTDETWDKALKLVHKIIQKKINIQGRFEEINLFGAFIASQPKV